MSFARIRIIKDKTIKIVETSRIKKFDEYLQKKSSKDLYLLKHDGRLRSCCILQIADSKKKLEKMDDGRRDKYHRFNDSDIISTTDKESSETEEGDARENRKKRKKNKRLSEKATTKDIVDIYRKHRKRKSLPKSPRRHSSQNMQREEAENNSTILDKEEKNKQRVEIENNSLILETGEIEKQGVEAKNNSMTSEIEAIDTQMLESENDEFRISEHISELNDNSAGEARRSPLSEISQHLRDPTLSESSEPEDEQVPFGKGVMITKKALDKAATITDPCKYISTLMQGIWGVNKLANRCVSKRSNVKRPVLTPQKTKAIYKRFDRFLRKNEYTETLRCQQLKKLNAYYGHAISNAIKSVKRNQAAKEASSSKI